MSRLKYLFSFSKEEEKKTGVLTFSLVVHNFLLFAFILLFAMFVYAFLSFMFEDFFYINKELEERIRWLYLILVMLMLLIWMIGYFASISVLMARLQFFMINENHKLVRVTLIPQTKNELRRWRSASATSKLLGNSVLVNYHAQNIIKIYQTIAFLKEKKNVEMVAHNLAEYPVKVEEIIGFQIVNTTNKKIVIQANYLYKNKVRNKKMSIYKFYHDFDLFESFLRNPSIPCDYIMYQGSNLVANQENNQREYGSKTVKEKPDLKKRGKKLRICGIITCFCFLFGSLYYTKSSSSYVSEDFLKELNDYSNQYTGYGFIAEIDEKGGNIHLVREEDELGLTSEIWLRIGLDGSIKSTEYQLYYSKELEAESIYQEVTTLFEFVGELIDYDKTVEAMKKVQTGELANVSYKTKRSTYYLRMTTKNRSSGDRCIHFYYYSYKN